MWPDCVSNPGHLTYESRALPTAPRGPANFRGSNFTILASIRRGGGGGGGGQILKVRICSSRSKFLPLRVDPI